MDFRATPKKNLFAKLEKLLEASALSGVFSKRDLVALKLHFGELGNAAYIRPVFIRKIVEEVKKAGGNPFLTDANTLYAGARGNSVDHLNTAIYNGFGYSAVGAPLVIADGLRGRSEVPVEIGGNRFQTVYIAAEVVNSDALISIAHFKGHELSGYGGAIKNLGMGSASRKGKLAQHSSVSPKVKEKKCIGCGECEAHCSQHAISVENKKARINPETCIGCGECILICPNGAVEIQWNQSVPVFLENMVEYTLGVVKGKVDRLLNINFITDVSPACDCMPTNDAPIVRNIGVLASKDPVAIDAACMDMINQEPALPGSCLHGKPEAEKGGDKFKGVYPNVEWRHQLDYAQEMKLGTKEYELIPV